MNIKKGDKVMIMKGRDRGKSAKVLRVFPQDDALIVEGLNLYKKSVKARKDKEHGQIIDVPRPIRMANAAVVCSSCGKPTRIGSKVKGDKKERYCKKCNATL